jgi:uncharacterized protein YbcC (UPF0753/DUF2309 family)
MPNNENSYPFDQILERIRTKLPIQNPLHSFVHNNILMMFEGKEFHEALSEAGNLYRAQSYWALEKYKAKFHEHKITDKDMLDGIDQYALHYHDSTLATKLGLSLKDFYYRLMFSEFAFNDDDIQPEIKDPELWEKCANKMSGQVLNLGVGQKKYRAKEYWEKYYNESISSSTQPYIIRLISSYLDQGQSFWSNPYMEKGYWTFFIQDVEIVRHYGLDWQRILGQKLDTYKGHTTQQIIEAELERMSIPREAWESHILEILFDLKGWSGMVNKLEIEPWQATIKAPSIKLVDFIASLILIESSLDEFHAINHSTDLAMIYGREELVTLRSFQLTLGLYQMTKGFHLSFDWMDNLTPEQLLKIIQEVDSSERQHLIRLWHEAYENHFYREALSAIVSHNRIEPEMPETEAQVLFCIDDREESMRRHVEELNPRIKTFGVVGFFGIDMNFSSLKHNRLIAQCPPVITASRIVKEVPKDSELAKDFLKFNKARGASDLSLYYMSRTLFRGYLSTLVLGIVSIIPMFLQVFFPKQNKGLREKFYHLISPSPLTEIAIDNTQEGHGYTKAEMAKIVGTILNMCGLKTNFSKLVIMMAHGSTSNNNPFKQAYGCGACGGNAGIPNSRAFAKMANDPEVRELIKSLGIFIPNETFFVSGFHDTCTDEIHYFDLGLFPENYQADFQLIKSSLNEACKLNAFERCQRFSLPKAKIDPEVSLQHVKERAEDLAQPRPEYGHSTNALAIVGSRDMTKGLFLNRRSFLLTYDWKIDADGSILQQVILAGIPVAVNINMDYYFSCVDNDNFGCGSKLPLNLTSLLGVMTGSSSDLRIGLARQMVEIHEPIRNMTIVEAPLERVKKIFDNHGRLKKLLYNHWMRLTVFDPETQVWYIFKEHEFQKFEIEKLAIKNFKSSFIRARNSVTEGDFAEIG